MLFTVAAMAVVSVAACLVTATRVIGWKRVLKHATLVDVIFTVLMAVIMAGTLTGMLTAVLSGLLMALTLSGARWFTGVVEEGVAPRVSRLRRAWAAFNAEPLVLRPEDRVNASDDETVSGLWSTGTRRQPSLRYI